MIGLAALVACGGGDKDDSSNTGDSGTTTTVPDAWNTTATFSEVVETVLTVSFETPETGTALVEYGLDGAFDLSTPETTTSGNSHSVTLLGLKATGTYSYRPVLITDSGDRIEGTAAEVSVAPPPQGLPDLSVDVLDASKIEAGGGFTLLGFIGADTTWVAIIDRDGDYVWWHADEPEWSIGRPRLSRDGKSVLFNYADAVTRIDDVAGLTRVSLDGTEFVDTRTLLAHHDFVELPDGDYAWPAFDLRDAVEVTGYGELPLATDFIYEGAPDMADPDNPTEVFGFIDDFPADPFWTCSHMQVDSFVPGYYEWSHVNSISYVDSEDSYYLMTRWMDGLHKIDRATGQQVWQMNGMHGDFTIDGSTNPWRDVGDSDLWSHGHMSHMWADGFIMFDNGDHRSVESSRVVEYAFDEDAMTVEEVWSYEHPTGGFSLLLGDARKLPSGNVMLAWSGLGNLVEVTPDKEVVWSVQTGLGTVISRVIFIDDIYAPTVRP